MPFSQCWSYAKQVIGSIKKNKLFPFTSDTTQFAYIRLYIYVYIHTYYFQNLSQKTDYDINLEFHPQAQILGIGDLHRCLNTKM